MWIAKIFIITWLPLALGCFASVTMLRLEEPGGSPSPVTDPDLEAVVKGIEARLLALGFVRNPRIAWIRETAAEDPKMSKRVVDEFIKKPLYVWLLQRKSDGAFAVRVVESEWPFETDLMRSVSRAVEDALVDALPNHRVLVDRSTEWPTIPP